MMHQSLGNDEIMEIIKHRFDEQQSWEMGCCVNWRTSIKPEGFMWTNVFHNFLKKSQLLQDHSGLPWVNQNCYSSDGKDKYVLA